MLETGDGPALEPPELHHRQRRPLRGERVECFVRELDLTASYICLAYSDASTTLTEGVRIDAVLLPAAGTSRRRLERAPDNISFPLRKAEVKWWLVEPTAVGTAGDGVYRLLEADESG